MEITCFNYYIQLVFNLEIRIMKLITILEVVLLAIIGYREFLYLEAPFTY